MILLVDDERSRAENYVDELELAGYRVAYHHDIDEALQFLEDNRAAIELLVLDVMMPAGASFAHEDTDDGLDTGIYAVERVRPTNPAIPIVILTNRQDGVLRERLKHHRGLTILSKRDNLSDDFPNTVRQLLTGEE